MKVIYVLIVSCLIFHGCERKLCDKTSFSVILNNEAWAGSFKSCDLEANEIVNQNLFQIIVIEKNPKHDKYKDALLLYRIPFEEGHYLLDSIERFTNPAAEFWVYEHEYGTPTQSYSILPSSGSFITVEEIDLLENSFVISFHLVLTVAGVTGELHNSSYPKVITFSEGHASGQFKD